MDEQTRNILQEPFRPEQIKQRKGSFGKILNYVEGNTVIERLNQAFAHAWSFEVLSVDINTDAGEVIAHVRITAAGQIKDGYGSSQIKRQRESKEIVDLGNDIKAACTDALKKAATLYGVGLHLYQDAGSAEVGAATPEAVSGAESHARYSNAGRHAQQHQPQQQNQPYNTARSSTTHQHTNSAPDQRSGSTGRLSGKQHAYLLKLASAQGMNKRELSNYCQQRYGVVLDFLSRQDASALIDQLRQGEVPVSSGDAA